MSLPSDLQQLHSSFLRCNQEVQTFQIPRLQSCTTTASLSDFESEINSSIDGLKRTLTELELAIDESESSRERKLVSEVVVDLKTSLDLTRQSTRQALLAARRNVESSRVASAREALFLAADNAKERTGGASSSKDKLMTTSQDVTDALRRTVELMSSELEKSALSSNLLEESSQTLSSLSTQYGSLSTLMSNSVSLIKTMEREDLIGKGMVVAAMLFFLSCIGWILYVRVLSKGIGLVGFFWRLFGFNRLVGGGATRAVEDVQEKMSLVATTATAITSAITGTAIPVPVIFDAQDDLLDTAADEPLYDGDTATLTKQYTRPTEHIEL